MILKKIANFGVLLLLILVPFFTMAQTAPTPTPQNANVKNAVDWKEGGTILEDWFMKEFLTEWKAKIWSEYGTFIDMARALAGCFAIIYFALKSYEMMTGDKKLEILPLLRPFGLCMIIIYWGSFIKVVSFPTDLIAQETARKQAVQQAKVDNLRLVRAEYQYALVENLFAKSAETKLAAETATSFWDDPLGSIGSGIKETATSVVSGVIQMKEKFEITLKLLFSQGLELIALWILRIAVYTLFAIQIIYTSILIMLGPFSVALSILPMFKDSFSTWIARFISINLYVGIAFIVMFIGGVLQEFAMQSEINKYKEIVTQTGMLADVTKLAYLSTSGILSFGVVIIAFFISAITMFSVPTISTWIVSTSGVGGAVSSMGRGAQSVSGGATSVLRKFL